MIIFGFFYVIISADNHIRLDDRHTNRDVQYVTSHWPLKSPYWLLLATLKIF